MAVLVAVAVTLVAAGFALGQQAFSAMSGRMVRVNSPEVRVGGQDAAQDIPTGTAFASSGMVEVPELSGMRADEARVVLETAGFVVVFENIGATVTVEASRVVQSQRPSAGTVLSVESTVALLVPPLASGEETVAPAGKKKVLPKLVVCIDPGHQAHSDVKLEAIGPGSKTEKPRATGGSTGVTTQLPEYELALQISVNLKKRLEAAGVKVIMTRTTNDVRLANSTRAKMANRAKADLFVRIHGGVSTDPAAAGIATFYPSKNRWTSRIVPQSRTAAKAIQQAVCSSTGATDLGVHAEQGLAGFNWSKVPSVLVEAGYLSNPVEDKLLSSPSYQDRVAQGIGDGVMSYLNGAR